MNSLRIALWSGLFLLVTLTVSSCVHERMGDDTFYEIRCAGDPAVCLPSGNTVRLTRHNVGAIRGASLRLERFDAQGRRTAVEDFTDCVIPDVRQFYCRPALDADITGRSENTLSPWRMVQGRLLNLQTEGQVHYFNGLTLWRNRLLLGGYKD